MVALSAFEMFLFIWRSHPHLQEASNVNSVFELRTPRERELDSKRSCSFLKESKVDVLS